MQLHELKAAIVKKNFDSLYLFTGEEVGIMDLYIKMIARDRPIKRVDSLMSIYDKLGSNNIMNMPTCYVIRDDREYLKAEEQWGIKPNYGGNVVILVYTSVDKRGKFYKQNEHILVTFDKVSAEVLAKYIMKEVDIPATIAAQLAEMCDCDYSRIMLECDKLKHLAKANDIDHVTAYRMMLDNGLVFVKAGDVVFDFVDAVCMRHIGKAYELLKELKEFSDSPLGAITLLYNNFKNILLVQSFKGNGNITQATGLTGWQLGLAKKKMGHYTTTELLKALRAIKETERGIKTGWIGSEHSLDYILATIL